MTDREHRLRQRIDQLLDERERLEQRLHALLERRQYHYHRIYEQKRRADLWKRRATGKTRVQPRRPCGE